MVLNCLQAPITIYPWEINLSEYAGQPWVSKILFSSLERWADFSFLASFSVTLTLLCSRNFTEI